jgi:hypothetical protein
MRWMSVDVRKTYVAAVPLPVRRALRDGASCRAPVLRIPVRDRRAGRLNGRVRRLAYWNVNPADPYAVPVGGLGAFNYSPPIAWLRPFGSLEWPSFRGCGWRCCSQHVWLGGRGVRILWILAFPPVASSSITATSTCGSRHIALGFRYPWTWGFVLLTKVTPGVGLLWFALRREWRALGIALGVTGVIVAVSLVLQGQLWVDWLAFIGSTPEGGSVAQFQIAIPLVIRLPAAVILVAWGALTDRRWTVPVAATLALPVLWVSASRSARRWPASDCGAPKGDGSGPVTTVIEVGVAARHHDHGPWAIGPLGCPFTHPPGTRAESANVPVHRVHRSGSGSLIIQAIIATVIAVPFFFRQQLGRAIRSVRHDTGSRRSATTLGPGA